MKILLTVIFSFTILFLSAQIVNIPDINFKNALLDHDPIIDTNGDGEIQVSEAEAVTDTVSVRSRDIVDMTGIEAFINIRFLICEYNDIDSIDVSSIEGLWVLNLVDNNLTSIDVRYNSELTELYFDFNNVNSLDIKNNHHLNYLSCYGNELEEIDVSHNVYLFDLYCPNNHITSIDVSNNLHLTTLSCAHNNMSFLDVRNTRNYYMVYFDTENNPDLTCIYVDDAEWSNENWTWVDEASTFVETEAECAELMPIVNIVDDTNTIYPNPFNNYLEVNSFEDKNIQIELFDILGNKVLTTTNRTIDTSKIPTAFYIIRVTSEDGLIHTEKLFKE